MLDAAVQARIERALSFQDPEQVPTCDVLDNPRLFDYFSPGEDSPLRKKIRAYHELGVDICWRFDRRQAPRKSRFREWLEAPLSRSMRLAMLRPEEIEQELADFRQQQRAFEPFTHLAMFAEGILSVVYQNVGFDRFSERMYQEPLEVERLIDVQAENLRSRAQAFGRANLGKLFFVNDIIAGEKGGIFSEHFLTAQWLPRLRSAILPLKEQGVKVILHTPGDITALLDGLVDAGIDGIHPVDPKAGMDITLIKQKYYGKLLVFAGVPLRGQEVLFVKDFTRMILENNAKGGGLFIGSQAVVDASCPLANVLSLYTAAKEYRH